MFLASIVYGSRISLVHRPGGDGRACLLGTTLGLIAGFYGAARCRDHADCRYPAFVSSVLTALFPDVRLWHRAGQGADRADLGGLGGLCAHGARSTLRETQKEYGQAARVSGLPNRKIILRHVLPNVLTPLIVVATIQVGTFVLIEASLSFLGVGVPVTHLRWAADQERLRCAVFRLWWVSIFPGLHPAAGVRHQPARRFSPGRTEPAPEMTGAERSWPRQTLPQRRCSASGPENVVSIPLVASSKRWMRQLRCRAWRIIGLVGESGGGKSMIGFFDHGAD